MFVLTVNTYPLCILQVYSVPASSVPNAAIAGSTVLQNWKGATNAATTAAGFLSIDSTYQQFYLNEQCCRVVPPSTSVAPFGRFTACYWVDIASGATCCMLCVPALLELCFAVESYAILPIFDTCGSYFGHIAGCFAGLSAAQQKFLAGGAAAMWSDNYCPSPVCDINGTCQR